LSFGLQGQGLFQTEPDYRFRRDAEFMSARGHLRRLRRWRQRRSPRLGRQRSQQVRDCHALASVSVSPGTAPTPTTAPPSTSVGRFAS